MNWYGFIIACGIVVCVICAYFTAKRRGLEGDIVIDMIVVGLPIGIVCARIYYVIFDLIDGGHWTFTRFIGIDDHGLQGLAIYGGCIGCVFAALIIARWKSRKKNPPEKHVSFMQVLDLAFTFIILGQAIGRWGNFANQEAHGYLITDPSQKWFPFAVEIGGSWYYATFFYESMWDLMTFCILIFFYAGKFKSFDGFNFSCYCILYGAGRVWIEGLRSDSLWLVPPSTPGVGGAPDVGGIRVSQLLSILLITYGVVYVVIHIVRAKKAGKKIFLFVPRGKLDDSYFEYDKTKLAHPMPDIKSRKDGKKQASEDIIIDNNGVAIRVAADEPEPVPPDTPDTSAESAGPVEAAEPTAAKDGVVPDDVVEENYEDKWDD